MQVIYKKSQGNKTEKNTIQCQGGWGITKIQDFYTILIVTCFGPISFMQMLDENHHLIQCIMDYQSKGKTAECTQ